MRLLRTFLRRTGIPFLTLAISLLGARAGQGAFSVGWTGPNGDDNRGIAWADFNNDCLPDIVVVNNQPGSCVRVFRNDGGGSFTLVYTSSASDRPDAVAVADYNGDGLVDFAMSNYSGIPSKIYKNLGGFSFGAVWNEPYPEYSVGVDWGDYDNDGKPDLVINSLSASGVRFFHNNGGNSFTDAGLVTTNGSGDSVKFADYDKDGFLDLFEGASGWGSIIWKGNGTALPTLACTLPYNNNYDSDWKDFNSDNKLDVFETSTITVYRNAGGGSFPAYWTSGASQYGRGADYDKDGRTDYAVSEWAPRNFYIVHNSGGGAFVTIAGPSATGGPVAWGDYDGDGGPDIVGGNFQGSIYNLVVYHNDGPGFTPVTCTPVATSTPTSTKTPTNTQTKTATATPSGTPTNTRTITSTNTVTSSPTNTFTVTSTGTPTNTYTITSTHTLTSTPTNTPTPTNTGTPTNTFTITSTHTATSSPTNTPTPTNTGTPTNTFTITSTNTASHTQTVTWTNTPTSSATKTATSTSTNSPTPTATKTGTQTSTATATDTSTSTPTNTPTDTSTPCGYPGNTCTFTVTPTVGTNYLKISKNLFTPDAPVSISVSIREYPGHYSLNIYNTAGEQVRTLASKDLAAPLSESYIWDGTNRTGNRCGSGVYILYMMGPISTNMKKVVLINR